MEVTKIKIRKIIPKNGLVGFVSFVMDDCLFIGNIAIFNRLNQTTFRLVFPEKKIGDKNIQILYPVSSDLYFKLEQIVNNEMQHAT